MVWGRAPRTEPTPQSSPRGWWGSAALPGRKAMGATALEGCPWRARAGDDTRAPQPHAARPSPNMGRRGAEGAGPSVGGAWERCPTPRAPPGGQTGPLGENSQRGRGLLSVAPKFPEAPCRLRSAPEPALQKLNLSDSTCDFAGFFLHPTAAPGPS